ncbi:hypothetical protein FEK35_15080 [Nocardia cyriacigeorgica]|uniref:Uncharacterized protein n=1 Tax=Nocardia cyriacigeorgica TaxID=135487 RepID=A0A5R8PDH7_9NOCA|nr:hypothetical protein [Nocardia cyriacigeorgica]TLG09447.1 hypothetical protein FEK35_15080 [Nocardia cyriacigeorgica]
MNDALTRLIRTKKILAGIVFVAVGVIFMVAARAIPSVRELGWLALIPWTEFGAILVGAGVFSIWLDSYFERERSEADEARLRRLLSEQAPAIRDAVIEGFAFENEDLRRVATPRLLDAIIGNSLAIRLDDREFAHELYADIRDQAVRSVERWHDLKISVRLSMLNRVTEGDPIPRSGAGRMVITVRHEYTTIPSSPVRQFVSLSDLDEYRQLIQDPASTFAWYYRPGNGVDAGTKDAFELVQFTVDGEERPIRRTARKGAQTYHVTLGIPEHERDREHTIAYTYRLMPADHNRLLHFGVDQPTRGVDIELDYSDTDITHVNMIDFIPSSQKSVVIKSPDTVPGKTIGLQFDSWVMPKGGAAFVWVRKNDLVVTDHHRHPDTEGANARVA